MFYKRPSGADIQSLYFYSSKAWTVYQDDQECASTASDRPDGGLLKRHFLRPPLAQLQKGAWAQVKFNASRLLGTAFNGEELKDSYRIQARSLLRLVTSDGNFDYEIPVDVTVDEMPF
jgi:hypothetical protein